MIKVKLLLILTLISTTLSAQPIKNGGGRGGPHMIEDEVDLFVESVGKHLSQCSGYDYQFKSLNELYIYLVLRLPFFSANVPNRVEVDTASSSLCHTPMLSAINPDCNINAAHIQGILVLDDNLLLQYLVDKGHTEKSAKDMILFFKSYLGKP